jgi:hypothetical protein
VLTGVSTSEHRRLRGESVASDIPNPKHPNPKKVQTYRFELAVEERKLTVDLKQPFAKRQLTAMELNGDRIESKRGQRSNAR